MGSRIDIGPDGGPYVEIDEDNGDLIIRTPNDNIDFNDEELLNIASVAVDSLNTNNDASIDFNSEDVSNIGTLEATNIQNTELANGTRHAVHRWDDDPTPDSETGGALSYQHTSDVSTTTKVIYKLVGTKTPNEGIIAVVKGTESNDNAFFTDILVHDGVGGPVVIQSSEASSPDARTYSRNGLDLQLSMAANTYSITVSALGALAQ